MVSAWVDGMSLCLGQVATESKSNEITAVPLPFEMLDIKGAVVTLDAMNCQQNIVEQIVDQGADYVITVKGNQPRLLEKITKTFMEYHENGCSVLLSPLVDARQLEGSPRKAVPSPNMSPDRTNTPSERAHSMKLPQIRLSNLFLLIALCGALTAWLNSRAELVSQGEELQAARTEALLLHYARERLRSKYRSTVIEQSALAQKNQKLTRQNQQLERTIESGGGWYHTAGGIFRSDWESE